MNPYVTGAAIKELRGRQHLTQAELADRLHVSDKTISKWETGKGYPDIALLEPLAAAFRISLSELLSGNAASNRNVSANMLRSGFYVCPICGNVVHSLGELAVSCHGVRLLPEQAEPADAAHSVRLEKIEDEYFVQIEHEMTKTHYISFLAAVSTDGIQMRKLYPEGDASARIKCAGVERLYWYCNRDGLFGADLRARAGGKAPADK